MKHIESMYHGRMLYSPCISTAAISVLKCKIHGLGILKLKALLFFTTIRLK